MTTVTDHVSGRLSDLDMVVVRSVPPGGNWKNLPDDFPSQRVQQIREGARSGGGSRSTYYGRLRWDKPAYTINTFLTRPGNGCFIHPSASRLITVREAARLQGFPDASRFTGSIRARAIQIGNAVPPLLAMQLGLTIPPGNFVDIFCGVGGMSSGFELVGHVLLAAADSDRNAAQASALNSNHPDRIWCSDLTDEEQLNSIVAASLERGGGHVDTLVGGPPCQGFSTAGHCQIGDPRNKLVQTFLSAVRKLRPTTVLMENVPALLWRGSGFLFELTTALHDLGYATSVVMLHAEGYGVPQLRRRLFVQGKRGDIPAWPAPTHSICAPYYPQHQPAFDTKLLPPVTVRDAISDLPESDSEKLDKPILAAPPMGRYQAWCQGHITADEILPAAVHVNGDGQVLGCRTWKTVA